jgi:hypothetical protein
MVSFFFDKSRKLTAAAKQRNNATQVLIMMNLRINRYLPIHFLTFTCISTTKRFIVHLIRLQLVRKSVSTDARYLTATSR